MTEDERKLGGYIPEPKCVIQETKEWIKDENNNFMDKLNERFEITNNPEDYVESKKIIDYFINDCDMKLSSVKIGMILSKIINVEPRDKVVNRKKVRLGIKENKS